MNLWNLIIAIAALWLVVILWAATVLYVWWHSGRQGLPAGRRATWILLALVPFIGFLAYLWAGAAATSEKRRITLVKPPPGAGRFQGEAGPLGDESGYPGAEAERRLPTIAVVRQSGGEEARDPPTLSPRPAAARPATAAAPAGLFVSVVDGPHAGETFRPQKLPAVIGRSAGCAVCLEHDIGVSRQHAELYRRGRALWLRDLNSRHGTRLNGQAVTETALADGDTIQAGVSRLLLQYEESE
jgi:hypothetical protein